MPEGFALDATHAPHITVLQRYVRTPELDQVLDAVDAVVAGVDLGALDPPRRQQSPTRSGTRREPVWRV